MPLIEYCAELAIEKGFDVNFKMSFEHSKMFRDRRETALFFAVYNNDECLVELFLEHGADPNIDIVKPINIAVTLSNLYMCQMLLEHGAKLDYHGPIESRFPACIALYLLHVP